MGGSPRRALLAIVTAALVAALLQLVGPGAPSAHAADEEPCLSEKQAGGLLPPPQCDDTVPPITTFGTATPAPNGNGYIADDEVTFTFSGSHTDADVDPIGFQCQFYKTATAPSAWSSCTSPATYSNLDETTDTPYTFRVRAVDTDDHAITVQKCNALGLSCVTDDVPDYDATPESISLFVDTVAPNTFAFHELYDRRTPDWPLVTTTTLPVDLDSNEADAIFVCAIGGDPRQCSPGDTQIRNLPPGDQTLTVTATDLAGNADPTPAKITFAAPTDLVPAGDWQEVGLLKAYRRDVLESTVRFSEYTLQVEGIRELRLLAPVGPERGKIQYAIGEMGGWKSLDLRADEKKIVKVFNLKWFNRLFTGPIKFRCKRLYGDGSCRIDAVLLH